MTDFDRAPQAFVRSRQVPIFAIMRPETVGEEREGWRARYGVMIRPDYGANYSIYVLLTDAELHPTPPEMLPDSFDSCADCRICEHGCPCKAIDPDVNPPTCYHNQRCGRYVQGMREKVNAMAQYHGDDVKICSRCFSACPWRPAFALAHPERFLWSARYWQLKASG